MIVFVYKTGFKNSVDGKNFKPLRKNSKENHSLLFCVPMLLTRLNPCVPILATTHVECVIAFSKGEIDSKKSV